MKCFDDEDLNGRVVFVEWPSRSKSCEQSLSLRVGLRIPDVSKTDTNMREIKLEWPKGADGREKLFLERDFELLQRKPLPDSSQF